MIHENAEHVIGYDAILSSLGPKHGQTALLIC